MRLGTFVRLFAALAATFCLTAAIALAVTPERAEYSEQVEPICKANTKANERILSGVKKQVRDSKLKPAAAKFAKASQELKRTLNELRAVSPPPADRARVEKWLAGVKLESELFGQVATKLKGGDRFGATRLVSKLNINATRTNIVMLPFSFRYCVFEPSRFT